MDPHWQPGDSLRSVPPSSSSLPKMDEDNNYLQCLPQQQLENMSVQDILSRDYEHNGFLYKRAQEKMTDQITEFISPSLLSKWQLRYVILYHEYVLYYKNERCTRPKGVFSLRGYNRVLRAEDMTSANQQWAFKIIGLRSDDRTWYFGAASEREMRLWMAYFKVTMEKAIHGKARDKSLKILKDLKYRETKFLQGGNDQASASATNFEPGIYEDIEEPLEEADYLPPKPGPSVLRQLPPPPRNESLDRGGFMTKRGPLPVPPPRPDPIHRESALSTASTESEDYILPQEADALKLEEFRSQCGQQNQFGDMSPPRQLPSRPCVLPPPPNNNKLRQGPEGNSFRKKPFVEAPPTTVDVKDMRAALKPTVPHKPKISAKPTPPAKPETPLKPKPAVRSPVSKEPPVRHSGVQEPATRNLLPASCIFNSSDKREAERMLCQYCVDGMYLLRLSAGPGKVLMVYHKSLDQCKHYKVFGNEVNTFSLTTEPIFSNMQELLQHYSDFPLPNTTVRLTQPYLGMQ
ncbi:SH3 domain-binding protein 2-like [Acanthaster planci]|uniref:SH3 domain-binding protein 2-like n=1 Tax=Acanthaster planci TaxID=133434 RepID=A0A8B7Y2M7_ACAPL|nr:SH3 domain-binding protein 2-like [Acanthaster planci]XP_022086559.1 SH3 domain-binding protein 2-like [Acanthaster planci]XP_022086560.1 SH3 domain-binding protein 2-like [Acanthaster planci]